MVVRGPFSRQIRYAEVERLRLVSRGGSSVDRAALADAIELQTALDNLLRWGAYGVTLKLPLVVVDGPDLLSLLVERCPAAHVVGERRAR